MPNENDGFLLCIQELADAVDVALQRHIRHWCLIFPVPRQVRSQDRVAVLLQRSHDLVPTPSAVECSVNKDECAHVTLLSSDCIPTASFPSFDSLRTGFRGNDNSPYV